MKTMLRLLLAGALALLPLVEALAGSSTITTKDASGVTKTFFVTTDGGGNFYAAGVICDQSAAAACASVGTAGSPSTNALTVQAVTIGHGTAANAMRVELPTDGTGLVSAAQSGTWNIGTVTTVTGVTTVSTVTNLAQMNGAALLMGNGATGTGSQRLTIANDNTLPTGWASSVAQASTTSGQTGPLAQCAVTTAAPTYTTAQTSPLSCDTTGNLRVLGTGVAQGSTTSGQTGSLVMGAVTTAAPTYTTAQTSPVSLDTAGNTRVAATPYPSGATPYTASATGTTGATTATLAGAASVTTYICGFSIRANATAAATGNATVTGTITGTLNFTQWTAPTASGIGLAEMIFAPCVPASAANTGIAVVSAAPGSGGVVSVSSWGYKL